jgi:hypothetical protein
MAVHGLGLRMNIERNLSYIIVPGWGLQRKGDRMRSIGAAMNRWKGRGDTARAVHRHWSVSAVRGIEKNLTSHWWTRIQLRLHFTPVFSNN